MTNIVLQSIMHKNRACDGGIHKLVWSCFRFSTVLIYVPVNLYVPLLVSWLFCKMSENKDSNLPDASVCESLCKQFADISNTDTAFAQYFLQRRNWELNRAIEDYFNGVQLSSSSSSDDDELPVFVVNAKKVSMALANASNSRPETSSKISKLKFITWNVDGLDGRSLKARTENVAAIIKCEQPDVVHLQEIIPETYSTIESMLPDYQIFSGNSCGQQTLEYFTATLLRRASITYNSHEIISFPNSDMARSMLVVKAKINASPFVFINTHLESTKPFAEERKRQLKMAFKQIFSTDANQTVVFAGDLNLRDQELEATGGIPTGLEDLWVTCGTRQECRFTWDPVRNSNIEGIPYPHKARLRFDRVYLRNGSHSNLIPRHFGLIGLEKIKSCGRFPSDHWGIVCYFDL